MNFVSRNGLQIRYFHIGGHFRAANPHAIFEAQANDIAKRPAVLCGDVLEDRENGADTKLPVSVGYLGTLHFDLVEETFAEPDFAMPSQPPGRLQRDREIPIDSTRNAQLFFWSRWRGCG